MSRGEGRLYLRTELGGVRPRLTRETYVLRPKDYWTAPSPYKEEEDVRELRDKGHGWEIRGRSWKIPPNTGGDRTTQG